jgi:hypothetical protein
MLEVALAGLGHGLAFRARDRRVTLLHSSAQFGLGLRA